MHLPTHALLSWLVAETVPSLERRDRILVLVAGVIPDLDALTLAGGSELYQHWHRILCHNALSAVVYTAITAAFARKRLPAALLALVAFHLHLLCDVIGSAGPDGSIWPVPYLVPFDRAEEHYLRWSGQWGLASWQNVVITLVALVAVGVLGVKRGRTVVEAFSKRGDAAIVETLRARFSPRREPRAPDAPPT